MLVTKEDIVIRQYAADLFMDLLETEKVRTFLCRYGNSLRLTIPNSLLSTKFDDIYILFDWLLQITQDK